MERDKLLGTMDAKVWTDEFKATKDRLGDEEFDHAMMLAWFANAFMAGFDEANRRAKRALDALQAQLADRDAMILQMGEQAAVLAKENMAVKAQLRQVEGAYQKLLNVIDDSHDEDLPIEIIEARDEAYKFLAAKDARKAVSSG